MGGKKSWTNTNWNRGLSVRENFYIVVSKEMADRCCFCLCAHTINSWLLFWYTLYITRLLSVVVWKGIKTKSRSEIIFIEAKIIYKSGWLKKKFLWSCGSDDYCYYLAFIESFASVGLGGMPNKMTSTASPLVNFYQCSIYVLQIVVTVLSNPFVHFID